MDRSLPSFNALRTFAAAGRNLSFTRAAAELNVTQGAVSHLMRTLEEDLGVKLFKKCGRNILLTQAGAAYHRQVNDSIDQIILASRHLQRNATDNALAISVLPTLAMRWLIPRLSAFRRSYPDISITVITGDGPVDFVESGVDLAIRVGRPPFEQADVTHLMSEEIGIVCAPCLLDNDKRHVELRDLLDFPLLQHSTRPDAWQTFLQSRGVTMPSAPRLQAFEHFFMLAEAAACGMGVALLPLFLVRSELAAGRLVQAVPDTFLPDHAYYLLQPRTSRKGRAIRCFENWITTAI